jgi:trk system potassium uptake protein TrkA
MYVVVAGAGEVGYHVAHALRLEGHDVAIIDDDPKAVERAHELDALVVQGHAGSLESLAKANLKRAKLFIGATGDDEANMIACTIAKSFGVATIARLNDPDYLDETSSTKYRNIGIDVAVSPDLVAATKIANILRAPALASADIFVHGKLALVESKVGDNAPVQGKPLKVVQPPPGVNLVAIMRNEDMIIPRGNDVLKPGDRVFLVVLSPDALRRAEEALGLKSADTTGTVEKVAIAGASRIGMRLAQLLEDKVHVILIEKDLDKCNEAFERLRKTLVIHGDATDVALLEQEGLSTADAFVGASHPEEYNILSCLILNRLGVKRTVALINQPRLKSVVEEIGVNLAISVRQTVVSSILKWTYGMEALDLAIVAGGEARAFEVKVRANAAIVGKPLKKIDFPDDSVVGAIVRGDEVLLPRGEDVIQAGDKLLIFALHDAVTKVERLLKK